MRKVMLIAIAFMATSFISCGNSVAEKNDANDTINVDSVEQVDTIMTDSINH